MNILIGEDNPITRQVMEAQVLSRGHTVTAVSSAAEVVAHHATSHFDLLLLDFHLDEDAPIIIERMQAHRPLPRIYLLTAESAVRLQPKAEGLPVEAIWTKPLQSHHLDLLAAQPPDATGTEAGQALRELLGPHTERSKKIIDIFTEESPHYLRAMKQAAADQRARDLQATVHKAKAGYGYLGLTRLYKQLDALEERLDKPVLWADIENELDQLEAATRMILRQLTQEPKS